MDSLEVLHKSEPVPMLLCYSSTYNVRWRTNQCSVTCEKWRP